MIANIISLPREEATRRFSEGMERVPPAPSTLRVGRFSDGMASPLRLSADAVGSFADGLADRPAPHAPLHVGSFGDGYGAHEGGRPARPHRAPAPEPAHA